MHFSEFFKIFPYDYIMKYGSILVLPIGGQAARIGGIPKFLLPVSDRETLLGRHIDAAKAAGINKVYIICRPVHTDLIRNYLSKYESNAEIIELERDTQTMCETLSAGMKGIDFESAIIGLPDTYWSNDGLISAYKQLQQSKESCDTILAVFRIRPDQVGKLGQLEFDMNGQLLRMNDKDLTCNYEFAWGAVKFTKSMITDLDIKQPHVGYTVKNLLSLGTRIDCIEIDTRYFDCGTFPEYSLLLGLLNE
jgi:hypothetical protein